MFQDVDLFQKVPVNNQLTFDPKSMDFETSVGKLIYGV